MSKASEKRAIEQSIQDAARWVPESCRMAFSTMMRQAIAGRLTMTFSQISAGCHSHLSTGGAIMRLCKLGYAIESTVKTEHGEKRAWRLTTPAEMDLLNARANEVIQ